MAKLIGKSDNLALFSKKDKAIVVDTTLNIVVEDSTFGALTASRDWDTEDISVNASTQELADAALTTLDQPLVSDGRRMYTIPGGVQKEAKKGLKWRKEHDRGGTRVGYNTARRLAKGGQIGIEKVRHIAKYFPRHEVDKKAKGYEYGEDGFPSAGRIAWALWGGDAGQRWASAIVEREDKKKAKTASAF